MNINEEIDARLLLLSSIIFIGHPYLLSSILLFIKRPLVTSQR